MIELAQSLSEMYQCTQASIALTMQHGICMLFGGSFDPAYTVAIHAESSLVQPAMNRRTAAVTQSYLESVLKVKMDRGLVNFLPVAEESAGIAGEIVATETSKESHEGDGKERKERRVKRLPSMKVMTL